MSTMNLKRVLALACLALGACTTVPNIELARHFDGNPKEWPRQPVSAVTFQPITPAMGKKSPEAFMNDLEKRDYVLVGKAYFTGEQTSMDQLNRFAASVGADTVYGGINLVGTEQRSNMVLGSFTPGSYSYTSGTAYGSSTGSANTSGSTPWGPMNFNTTAFGSSSGTYNASTYNSPQMTFVRNNYEVPITQQLYLFYVSPRGVLRHWMSILRSMNASKSPAEQVSVEQWKQVAVGFAAKHRLPLPAALQPQSMAPSPPSG